MKSKIISQYKITYANGFIQTKDLISQSDYDSVLVPLKNQIQELEKNGKESVKSKELKNEIKEMFGSNFFTDDSPLYKAIETGYIELPESQGGKQKCKLELI